MPEVLRPGRAGLPALRRIGAEVMGVSPQVKLFKCGNCKRRFNNPATHVCKVKVSASPMARAAKAKKKKGWG